ncbi:MAG: hypothetical protein RL518_1030 [Pseudomonadota bacterium]|jgi:hypothetical protein
MVRVVGARSGIAREGSAVGVDGIRSATFLLCSKEHMAPFQDSRFLGLSGRTIVVTLIIAGAVIGLFFIPEAIKFALNSSGKSGGEKRAAVDTRVRREPKARTEDKGSLSPEALKALNSSVGATPAPERENLRKDGDDTSSERPGLFDGWNFKVKAGESNAPTVQVPASISFDKLGGKEFQGLLKQSRNDVKGFIKKQIPRNMEAQSVVETFMDQLDLAAKESAKGMSVKQLAAGLQDLHVSTIQALSRSGLDRGAILEWLKLPIVSFLDDRVGLHAQKKIQNYFVPRLTLRMVNVRQRPTQGWGMDGRSPATLRAELAFRGSDIERVMVYANGRKISEMSGPRSSLDNSRSVRVSGDAHGVWTFVAHDRFGAKPYWKSYSFYPKVRRFRQNRNGEYIIAFKPNSAPNSLDRFFLVGRSALRQNTDSMISTF